MRIAAAASARGHGVMVALAGEIYAARDALKSHTESVRCFAAHDGGPLGMVTAHSVTFLSRPERRVHIEFDRIEGIVQLIRMVQAANDLLLRACVQAPVPGIVVEATAGGNVNAPFYEGIVAAPDAGIPVVVATRVAAGAPHLGKGYRGSLMSVLGKGAISACYLSGLKARRRNLLTHGGHGPDSQRLAARSDARWRPRSNLPSRRAQTHTCPQSRAAAAILPLFLPSSPQIA